MTDIQDMLIHQEGMKLNPYRDSVGKITIGCGRNLDDKGITHEEAMMLLNSDIADAIDDVQHVCSIYEHLSRPRQMVLISMAFNLGRARLNTFVRFLGAIHREDWEDAAEEMLQSKWAKQVGQRAVILAQMMRHNTSEWV